MKLESRIRKDLERIGVKELDFKLDLRGYSKTFDGRYDPNTKTIVVYIRESDGMIRDYDEIIEIAIHEFIHHLQWEHDPEFVRYRGIMHNEDFFRLQKKYMRRWEKLNERILGEADKYIKPNIRANIRSNHNNMGKVSRVLA